eukprot:TRINITY_DN588_c0_g1_i1.p2 TRINITY_DN588_c0_g1~~TRINITY_DN588_c0_g1_i1.p2  ORF type:complete len:320 (+),score=177.90 TRINITY_DN588_c0_g1_i1:68-961(+)
MILLDCYNKIIRDYIFDKIRNNTRELDDYVLADFDGVEFHITADPNNKAIVNFSIRSKASQHFLSQGAQEDLPRLYGPMLNRNTEANYDITLTVNFDALPEEGEALALKISNLKRHLFAGPFNKAFKSVTDKKPTGILAVPYRQGEAFYLKPESDKCTVIFEISFNVADDAILSGVFLNEFQDARKSMKNVPVVTFNLREAPLELAGIPLQNPNNNGFVSIVVFEQHLAQRNLVKTINLLITFRNYLHYHIKCSKAYMHNRMRAKVASWLQILNRARPEPFKPREKKKMSGRTFVRK